MRDIPYLILLATALILLFVLVEMARAHEWYEPYCCSRIDCAPAKPGQVIRSTGPDGRLGYTVIDPKLPGGRAFVGDTDTNDLLGDMGQVIDKRPIVRDIPEGVITNEPLHVCITGYKPKVKCIYRNEPRL